MFSKHKMLIGVICGCLFLMLLTTPIILVGAVIASPFATVAEVFKNIGDFLFGGDSSNEAIDIMEHYFTTPEGRKLILEVYQPTVTKKNKVSVQMNYLVVPNMLIGLEEVTDAQLQAQVDAMTQTKTVKVVETGEDGKETVKYVTTYVLRESIDYIDTLRLSEPWKTGFDGITSKTIAGYIDSMSQIQIYQGLDPLKLAEIPEGEFIYPLSRKASVTATIGWYYPGGVRTWHDAIDLAFPAPNQCGMPVYSVLEGKVIAKQGNSLGERGNYVVIQSGIYKVYYYHFQNAFQGKVGDIIPRGAYLGNIGNTGKSYGCHLHLKIEANGKVVDPRDYIDFYNPKILE